MKWIERARCSEYSATADDWFVGAAEHAQLNGQDAETRRAVAICNTCPVIAECAAYAIPNEVYGVFGGLTPHARREIRRKRREAAV